MRGSEIFPTLVNVDSLALLFACLLFIRALLNGAADLGGRAVQGLVLRPLACRDCGFESRRRHGYFSLTSVVCCHVGVFAIGRSLVQRSPTDRDQMQQ